jgi:release factor glutamine methyltransferase
MIYEPAEDSYLLQKQVKKFVKKGMKVLDMGTGSGIQALTVFKLDAQVVAVDINPECVEQVSKLGIKTIESDLFQNIKEKFDLIIFNPPYLPLDEREPKDSQLSTTGGKTGSEVLNDFLKKAKDYLEKDGKILIVVSSLTKGIKKHDYHFTKLSEQKIPDEILIVYLIE